MRTIARSFSLGKRIKAKDRYLMRNYVAMRLLLIFIAVMLLLNINSLLHFPYSELSLFNRTAGLFAEYFNVMYLAFSAVVALLVCLAVGLLHRKLRPQQIRQLQHRQALARMLLDNKWYVGERVSEKNMWGGRSSRERIIEWPRLYYSAVGSHIIITVKATMGPAQKHLLKLEEKIETGLFCECVTKDETEPYYRYVFYHDLEQNRISINDVQNKGGQLELMRGFVWDMDKLPHALVVGGTGSGKTFFLLMLVKVLLEDGAQLTIIDPKNADLAQLEKLKLEVYSEVPDIVASLERFKDAMLQRSRDMKRLPKYKIGCNYRDVDLQPHFLIFDEYVAFMNMLDKKGPERKAVDETMKQIAMLGRQTGFFIVLACQRPDATYFSDGMRDQFHLRIMLGKNQADGYRMVFGTTSKEFFDMPAGRGYVDFGTNVITKFYVPIVPSDYCFEEEITKTYARNRKGRT